MDYFKESLEIHRKWKGKIETRVKVPLNNQKELGLAYTPGVASSCLAIKEDPSKSYELTGRGNRVAVVTDGSAVLGLGNIGPYAGLPVMEGKCALFKEFGNVDAAPVCLATQDSVEIVRAVKAIAPGFGGINLEDISAPRCFEIERRLQRELDIPVFHDDQHGTAIVALAALLNALKVVGKGKENARLVINGPGAAGSAIARFAMEIGIRHILVCGLHGILSPDDASLDANQRELALLTNKDSVKGKLSDALLGADAFIGVSGPHCVTPSMISSMGDKPIVFPLANPIPEISFDEAVEAGAYVVGTGSSEHPNQVNNLLAFPGLFRGVLDARALSVTTEMQKAACFAIASYSEPSRWNVLPSPLDKKVHLAVAKAVYEAASK